MAAKLLYTTLATPHRGRGQPGLTEAEKKKKVVEVGMQETETSSMQSIERVVLRVVATAPFAAGKIRRKGIELDQEDGGLGRSERFRMWRGENLRVVLLRCQ